MRKTVLLMALLIPSFSSAALTKFWISNGGYKLPQDDLPPSTTNYNWNGTTAYTFGAKNETVSLVLFIGNDTGADVSEVSVTISSFSKVGGGAGFASVEVSSMNVWNMVDRPIQQFIVRYIEIEGIDKLVWEDYYDQYHIPAPMRRECTPNESGYGGCTPLSTSYWEDRPNHNKFYADIMEPYENVKASSFTVQSSSSQAVWFDIFNDKTREVGDYTASITVREGITVSTVIPVSLKVYNFTLPDTPSLNSILVLSESNIYKRHYGEYYPSNSHGEPYYTTRKKYAQMIKAHGMIPFGDDNVYQDYPYPQDLARLNGTLYSATTGYYGRGQDVGDKVYPIGGYGSWRNWWSATDSANFCGHVAAWQEYFRDNHPDVLAFVYLHDETLDGGNVEKWANWMSTAPACQTSGYTARSFITMGFPEVEENAPHINMPCAASWMGVSSATWQAAADHYTTQGTTQAWAYNGNRPWWGTIASTADDGVSPLAVTWSTFKKGIQGYFYWESTYYNDFQGGRGETDLWHDAETFGGLAEFITFNVSGMTALPTCDYTDSNGNTFIATYSSYTLSGTYSGSMYTYDTDSTTNSIPPPAGSGTLTKVAGQCWGSACSCTGDATISYASWTETRVSLYDGKTGWNYSNGDGVLIYPGTDKTFPADSRGVDAPYASWRLKMFRRGSQDYDYLTMANVIDSATVSSMVQAAVPRVMWEYKCDSLGDCTYVNGPVTWSENPDVWETNREILAGILDGQSAVVPVQKIKARGRIIFRGRARVR